MLKCGYCGADIIKNTEIKRMQNPKRALEATPSTLSLGVNDSHAWHLWRMKYAGAAPPRQDVYGGGQLDLNSAIYLLFGVVSIHNQSSAMGHQRATGSVL